MTQVIHSLVLLKPGEIARLLSRRLVWEAIHTGMNQLIADEAIIYVPMNVPVKQGELQLEIPDDIQLVSIHTNRSTSLSTFEVEFELLNLTNRNIGVSVSGVITIPDSSWDGTQQSRILGDKTVTFCLKVPNTDWAEQITLLVNLSWGVELAQKSNGLLTIGAAGVLSYVNI